MADAGYGWGGWQRPLGLGAWLFIRSFIRWHGCLGARAKSVTDGWDVQHGPRAATVLGAGACCAEGVLPIR